MIHDLLDTAKSNSFQGRLVSDLAKLAVAGVAVVPTAVLPVECFSEWQNCGSVSDSDVEQLLRWAGLHAIEPPSSLIIRASLSREYYGLLGKLFIKCNFAGIRSGIDRIYRSWGDERARASRIVCKVNEAESKPALIIQAVAAKAYSVLTRHAIAGTLTTITDYEENVNNRVPQFSHVIDRLICTCDAVLGRAVRVDFTSNEYGQNLAVLSVSDEVMTTDGRWRALADLLDRTVIDEVQFLMAITPDMVGFASGLEFDPRSTSSYVQGLPASSGLAVGQLVFRGARLRDDRSDTLVFLADDSYPEDIHLLGKCCAAIGLRGDMTSHLAVVCRGMQIPAVTGCGGRVDLRKRIFETVSGQKVTEFTTALVDGRTGSAGFSGADVKPHWVKSDNSKDLTSKILECCARLPHSDFKKLPVQTQWHIAELKSRMREMGLIR